AGASERSKRGELAMLDQGPVKVSMLSTWETPCGVAGYTGALVDALRADGTDVDVVAIDRSGSTYLPQGELVAYFGELAERLADADVAHIQHEFGIYGGGYGYAVSTAVLSNILRRLAMSGTRTALTLHTEPFAMLQERRHVGRIGYEAYLRSLWRLRIARLVGRLPLDVVVHTRASRRATIDSGIPADRVRLVRMGVPAGVRVSAT